MTKSGHVAALGLLLDTRSVGTTEEMNMVRRRSYGLPRTGMRVPGLRLPLDTDRVDTNAEGQDGQTALSWAGTQRHENIVRVLLALDNIEVNCKDRGGRTPLYWAAF